MKKLSLHGVYDKLLEQYGHQSWWPADSAFEMMTGAVLTQNTAWANVERAIVNLRAAGLLDPAAILACDSQRLAQLLRPSGYFNVKARRLRNLCHWYRRAGGMFRLRYWRTSKLRTELLKINGIGAETADDILLYAFARPVFVIDAYTRRLFSRLGLLDASAPYEQLRARFEDELGNNTRLFNEYHALIVAHAKTACRASPDCGGCALASDCEYAQSSASCRVSA